MKIYRISILWKLELSLSIIKLIVVENALLEMSSDCSCTANHPSKPNLVVYPKLPKHPPREYQIKTNE